MSPARLGSPKVFRWHPRRSPAARSGRQRISRWCQRSNVSGVTSRPILKGAGEQAGQGGEHRPVHSSFGLGFCRGSTVTP